LDRLTSASSESALVFRILSHALSGSVGSQLMQSSETFSIFLHRAGVRVLQISSGQSDSLHRLLSSL
jgi:hypothetical protein